MTFIFPIALEWLTHCHTVTSSRYPTKIFLTCLTSSGTVLVEFILLYKSGLCDRERVNRPQDPSLWNWRGAQTRPGLKIGSFKLQMLFYKGSFRRIRPCYRYPFNSDLTFLNLIKCIQHARGIRSLKNALQPATVATHRYFSMIYYFLQIISRFKKKISSNFSLFLFFSHWS
jgi:hypothetical protein